MAASDQVDHPEGWSAGEITGGGTGPAAPRPVAQTCGIGDASLLALTALTAGIVVRLFLVETAPPHLRSHRVPA
jgi:hypothetical protein